jgi:hypothetical protein
LGYCTGQEIREGEQWICLSGAWESWEKAIALGIFSGILEKDNEEESRAVGKG